MERSTGSTALIVAMLGITASPTQGSAAHIAAHEVPMSRLFQNAPAAGLARKISSQSSKKNAFPVITFLSPIALNSSGESRIGKSCYVRNTSLMHNSGKGYFQSALAQTPGGEIKAGEAFEMEVLSAGFDSIRFDLSSIANPSRRLEIGCSHAKIQSWTIADFESSSSHLVRVRIPASLVEKKSGRIDAAAATRMEELKGNRFNGVFGSGLPGTSGVQLLFGANLKAYADETGAALMQGRKCRIMAQSARSLKDRYLKGSKFSFLGYQVKKDIGTVEMVFGNWNHSPHQIRIECLGDESSVKSLSLAQIENDLNGSIKFYRK